MFPVSLSLRGTIIKTPNSLFDKLLRLYAKDKLGIISHLGFHIKRQQIHHPYFPICDLTLLDNRIGKNSGKRLGGRILAKKRHGMSAHNGPQVDHVLLGLFQ